MTITEVRATALTKHFDGSGGALALPDVVLAPGEVVALTGPTRSGKTTFVNLLAGWDRPDTGTIVWEGAPPGLPPWSMLAVVPQQFALVDELDVIDNITLAARGGTPMTDADVAQLLDALKLDRLRNRNVQEISVGERQRVMVARALAGAPAVVLADEPVAHQDRQNADTILGLLCDRAARGSACLIATREADVAAWADRTIELGRAVSHPAAAAWSDDGVTTRRGR